MFCKSNTELEIETCKLIDANPVIMSEPRNLNHVFFVCGSVGSLMVMLAAWTRQLLWWSWSSRMTSMLLGWLWFLKVFGVAFLVVVSVGIAIVIWEQILMRNGSSTHGGTSEPSLNPAPGPSPPLDPPTDRSVLPLVLVMVGLGLFAVLLSPSASPHSQFHHCTTITTPPKKGSRREPAGLIASRKNGLQFSLGMIALAVVVGLIVCNHAHYRATWKARRRPSSPPDVTKKL